MIHEDITLSGSLAISGSLILPRHASSDSATAATGSIYNDTTDNVAKIYTGTEWQVIGEQAEAAVGVDIEYLVVAGGGGGGARAGGGGGAGGYLSSSLSSIESGSSITVTVGAAGAAGTGGANGQNGGDGGDSSIASAGGTSFTTVTSIGGGGGGGADASGATPSGGSGGGASYSGELTGGSGTTGQGFDGGDAVGAGSGAQQYKAGGGGGASEVGQDGNDGGNGRGGNGGDGLASSITGTSTTRAGGGGGGTHNPSNGAGSGGSGGGGAAGAAGGKNLGTAGTANTGGGGGGGSTDSSGNSSSNGAAGGSGVVILAYPTGSVTGQGGIKTSRSDGYFVHQFNSSGTLTIAGAGAYPAANNSVFAPILYTGDGTTSQAITGVGFQPDLIWIKNRDASSDPIIQDTVRGITKMLETDGTAAESNNSVFGHVNSVESDGFTVDDGGSTEENANKSGRDYVAWCWKAGGTAVSNSDGNITSQVSANTAAGFSIVKYTGNSGATRTVGHGLSSAPELIIVKNISDGAQLWSVYSSAVGNDKVAHLNTTAAFSNSGDWGSTTPTSTVFTIGSGDARTNSNGEEHIAYCFHSVAGYQKIGSYTGNGSNTGPEVTTGFKPRFLLIKDTTEANSWVIHDSARDTSNPRVNYVLPNASNQEASDLNGIDFNSDGFQLKDDYQYYNKNNNTYIYLAIG